MISAEVSPISTGSTSISDVSANDAGMGRVLLSLNIPIGERGQALIKTVSLLISSERAE